MIFLAISLPKQARGRSTERPRAGKRPVSALYEHIPDENNNSSPIRYRKRLRKSIQYSQFEVYEDETLDLNSSNSDTFENSTPVKIGPQTGKIWPHISVEIPFRPDLQVNSAISTSKKGNRKPLADLSSLTLNGAQKAPKIPQNWMKNQPNDHTS